MYREMFSATHREDAYNADRKQLLDSDLSNSQIYDRTILTLSSSILGVSIVFIGDVVPLNEVQSKSLLFCSWWLLLLAILATMVSFLTSHKAIKQQLEIIDNNHQNNKEECQVTKIDFAKLTEKLNCLSGIFFLLAISFTICFIQSNLP